MEKSKREARDIEKCLAVVYYPFKPDKEVYKRLLDQAKLYLTLYPNIEWSADLEPTIQV
jgi:hypothetical protein